MTQHVGNEKTWKKKCRGTRQGRLSKASAVKVMPLQWLFHSHADLWDKGPCLKEVASFSSAMSNSQSPMSFHNTLREMKISDKFSLSRLHPCHLFSESPNSRACQNPQALR
ncbi:MAG: hypothetical protein B9S30_07135 [Verrucomicrobiia bacterium Tous-C5FEB]|nr:MAG: hypothetical protein B9S30_07135 [Verrucomicrobiae bacterium Tous-C5FEB]